MCKPSLKYLRLQLLSYDTSSLVLDLLRTGNYELSHRGSFRARLFAGNKREAIPQTAIGELAMSLHDRNFNAVTILSSTELGKFRMDLEVSPNNRLWADTRSAGGPSPKDELLRMGFESIQVRVARLGIRNYPTTLNCVVALQGSKNTDTFQTALAWIIESLKQADLNVACLGGADVLQGVTGEMWSSFANALDVAPGGTDQNRDKFDRLHDVMICPTPIGEQFASLLSEKVRLDRIVGTNPLAVLAIPPDPKWRRHAMERVQDLLIPQGVSPSEEAAVPGASSYPIYSRHEYEELDSRGKIPRLGWDWVLHPVLGPEHGKLLGIETEDMLVLPMQRMTAMQIEREVGEALDQKNDVTGSVLEYYEQIYNRHFNSDYVRRVFDRLRHLQRSIGLAED